MTRTQIREHIFTILFRVEFTDREEFQEQLTFALEEIAGEEKLSASNSTYMEQKLTDIVDRLADIDAQIAEQAKGWKLSRIGKAELAILRLAVYELKYEEAIPDSVAINEAVELSKRYCDEEAKGFINAVLRDIERAC